jgi:F-type H+-transporting ATPase subunit delta
LITPAVQASRKRAAAGRLADTIGMHRLLKHFIFVLIDHRRTPLFDAIREAYQARMDGLGGVVRAQVAAATELGAEKRQTLTAKLEAMTASKVVSSYTVDPALLGGVTVRMGSTIYDGSVRGHLETLRRKLGAH